MTTPAPALAPEPRARWPLILAACAAFIPVLGVLIAAGVVTWALLHERPGRMAAIVVAGSGALLQLLVPLVLVLTVPAGERTSPEMAGMAQRDLGTLVVALEAYRGRSGRYPQDLRQLLAATLNPAQVPPIFDVSRPSLFPRRFEYHLAADGENYDVFSRGPDGVAYTADDIRPQLPDSQLRRTGYRPAAWSDPSLHLVRSVTVAPGVRLEVLDWGGADTGRARVPLVFLSGLQDVAHCFDDFAPQFTGERRVLAITRRGYGASSQPVSGYDLSTRVADLTAALDSLRLTRVVLAGHSIAGDELTAFAAAHPDRVAGLIYLDAAYDHTDIARLLGGYPQQPPMSAADSASPAAVTTYVDRVYGVPIPEAQVRATEVFGANGKLLRNVTPDSIDAQLLRGTGHPDYGAVHAPVLAIYAVHDDAAGLFPWWGGMSDSTRRVARAFVAKLRAWSDAERDRLRRGIRGAAILPLPGANHYVFMSNRRQVTDAMRSFLALTPH